MYEAKYLKMDYRFYNAPTKRQKALLKMLSPVNKLFSRLHWTVEIGPGVDEHVDMITIEQRMNLFHLANEVLIHNIEGDFIEFGCHTGNSAMQIQTILSDLESHKSLHVYDNFTFTHGLAIDIKGILIDNFSNANLKVPNIHEGFFNETVPSQLPEKLAFVHIDCGFGGHHEQHKEVILHLLEHIYPLMSPKAICLLMDYHDVEKTVKGSNSNPGVKMACDAFFANRPEKVNVLYGNHFSHGYFRKE